MSEAYNRPYLEPSFKNTQKRSSDTQSGEVDPNGTDQHAPGAKLDHGKPDMSLLLHFGRALQAVAGVGTIGANKYSRGGWQSVPDGVNRYTAALGRHMYEEHYDPVDSDTGCLHAAQVAWNALARLELMLREAKDERGPDST